MAALTFGSVTVTCPVCGDPLTLKVEARKVVHARVDPDEDAVTMTARLHVELPDFDDPTTFPDGHVQCFTVADEDRAAILAFESGE
jgi:hypothetical protein